MMNKLFFFFLLIVLFYLLEFFFFYNDPKKINRKKHFKVNILFSIVSYIFLKFLLFIIVYFNIDFFSFKLFTLPNHLSFLYFIILDFFIYLQHVLSHRLDWFWALHKVHHADHFLDTSSGLRFHPLEIVVSYFYKMLVVIIIGVPKEVFVLYEIMLSAMALFNHSNIKIPHFIDKYLRLILVTPSFHYVHHSTENDEMNSHYGNTLSIWDRIFRTYKRDSLDSDHIVIGLKNVSKKKADSFKEMLLFPLGRD